MSTINVSADGLVNAPAPVVYGYIADMHQHHPRFLPDAFSDFEVEAGGVGAGTVTRFKVTAGGRAREYHMRIEEPEPGRVLTESDTESSLVTTWTVEPEGDRSRVRIATAWEGAGGVGGFFERTFAPRVMKRIYAEELAALDRYAQQQAAGTAAG